MLATMWMFIAQALIFLAFIYGLKIAVLGKGK